MIMQCLTRQRHFARGPSFGLEIKILLKFSFAHRVFGNPCCYEDARSDAPGEGILLQPNHVPSHLGVAAFVAGYYWGTEKAFWWLPGVRCVGSNECS